MEQHPTQDANPSSRTVDKSKVLDAKPLRTLVPVFPSAPNFTANIGHQGSAPFVCVPPNGPFPPGVAPFFPFHGAPASVSAAMPISSYRSTPRAANGNIHGEGAEEDGFICDQKVKAKSQKRVRGSNNVNLITSDSDSELMVNEMLASPGLNDIIKSAEGQNKAVSYVLQVFDFLRRKVMQVEDSNEASSGMPRRPDLKVAAAMTDKGIRANAKKRIGAVPGVEVGDIFFFRMELCIVGLHYPNMGGIDYLSIKISQEEEPLAVSIVSSGGYDDNDEDAETLIYSGQGGNLNSKGKETTDQKLERGNLALEKSLHRGNEVKVIRGVKDGSSKSAKIYVYDGLYKIHESWVEKGASGFSMFKYKLVRLPGQPDAFRIWKSIQQWKNGNAVRHGVILPDITSGSENLPISLVNDIDDEKGPPYFTYSSSLKYPKAVTPNEPIISCSCAGECLPGNRTCACIQKNGGYLPYVINGVLANQKSLIHECGPLCNCPPTCRNRVTQGGLKFRLEVFKTKDRGWGLRSWEPIRAGAFICEYAGEVISISDTNESQYDSSGNSYIFNSIRKPQPVFLMPHDSSDISDLPFQLIISAQNAGNVARFMNHSCSPNVFWQPVLRANSREPDLHIVFHAIRHIPPMAEITFDYGMVDKGDPGSKSCLCGSVNCRGFFC